MGSTGEILVGDDEARRRDLVAHVLAREGDAGRSLPWGHDVLQALGEGPVALIIADIRLPAMAQPTRRQAVQGIAARCWPQGRAVRGLTALHRQMAATAPRPDASDAAARQSAHRLMAASLAQWRAAGLVVSAAIKAGDLTQGRPQEADAWHADGSVVGARGLRRIERFCLGSVSAAVAARVHGAAEGIRAGQTP